MKLPVFEEIKTKLFDTKTLLELFKMHGAGSRPLFLELEATDQSDALNKIDNILGVLDRLTVNPFLPYGIYVITDKISYHDQITVIKSKDLLPKHFFKKVKRLKSKESTLLNRVSILANKVSNLDIEKLKDDISYHMVAHKELHKICEEIEYYEDVMNSFKGPED